MAPSELKSLDLIKICFGVLKCLELVSLGIAWACIFTYFDSMITYMDARIIFFFAIHIFASFFVIIWFLAYLIWKCYRITPPRRMVSYGVVHLLLYVLLLLASILLLLNQTESIGHCNDIPNHECPSEVLECAMAFGIVSSVIFLVDGILHIQQRNEGLGKPPKVTAHEDGPTERTAMLASPVADTTPKKTDTGPPNKPNTGPPNKPDTGPPKQPSKQ
eukprot:TCONS_00053210-protein